jgi:hypothetical protein
MLTKRLAACRCLLQPVVLATRSMASSNNRSTSWTPKSRRKDHQSPNQYTKPSTSWKPDIYEDFVFPSFERRGENPIYNGSTGKSPTTQSSSQALEDLLNVKETAKNTLPTPKEVQILISFLTRLNVSIEISTHPIFHQLWHDR